MVITHEDVNPSLIANTTMQRNLHDGVHKSYYITPVNGYVLHDQTLDCPVFDDLTGAQTGDVIPGYRRTTASCAASYDFASNPREFYAVSAEQINGNK